jgi:serine/threonine protein kinase/formylglycine-generating enzyme required for sulfatase activity
MADFPNESATLNLNSILGNFRLIALLGEGGMGKVFVAEDLKLGRKVALKVMQPNVPKTEQERTKMRFLREARSAAQVEHERIVRIYQADEDRGVVFIAMELLQGEALERYLDREPLPALNFSVQVALHIAEGLAAAHQKGLIHRDIKPSNVWLEPILTKKNFRTKILDFGLAKPVEGESLLTASGQMMGTPAYMSPEQWRGKDVDERSDLFSLGVLFYQMTTAHFPFGGESYLEIARSVAMDDPAIPSELNPNIPPPISDLILRLLAKDKEKRPRNAQAVALLLEELLTQSVPSGIHWTPVFPEPSPLESASHTEPEIFPKGTELEIPPVENLPISEIPNSGDISIPSGSYWAPRPKVPSVVPPITDTDTHTDSHPTPALIEILRPKETEGNTNHLKWFLGGALLTLLFAGMIAIVIKSLTKEGNGTQDETKKQPEELALLTQQLNEMNQKVLDLQNELANRPPKSKEDIEGNQKQIVQIQEFINKLEVSEKQIRELQNKLAEKPEKTSEQIAKEKEQATLIAKLEADRQKFEQEIKTLRMKNDELRKSIVEKPKKPEPLDCTGPNGMDEKIVQEIQKAWAKYLEVEVDFSLDLGGVSMDFVLIPPGKYRLGSSANDLAQLTKESSKLFNNPDLADEKQIHIVEISKAIYFGKTEVTREQFARFVQGKKEPIESEKEGGFGWDETKKMISGRRDKKYSWDKTGWDASKDEPVVNVSWNDAQLMAKWVERQKGSNLPKKFTQVRLPREAEWEYAARAGNVSWFQGGNYDPETTRLFGNVLDRKATEKIPNVEGIQGTDDYTFTAPVKKFPPNAFDLFDMLGNVMEWCEDGYDPDGYSKHNSIDPFIDIPKDQKVVRGGSWKSELWLCRQSTRTHRSPTSLSVDIGFRLVLTTDKAK